MSDKKLGQLPPRAAMEAVKAAQPKVVLEIAVRVYDNNNVMVVHPDTDDVRAIGQFIDVLATGIQTLARMKLAKVQEQSRIVKPPPGIRLQG